MAGRNRWVNIRHRARASAVRSASGTGHRDREDLARVRFEGYGPGGAAVMLECLSEDRSRCGDAVRRVFAAYGGHIGAAGSVSYLFNNVGLMAYPPGIDTRRLTRAALAAGAEDVVTNDDTSVEVLTDPVDFIAVRACLSEQGLAPAVAEVTWRAASALELSGEASAEMRRLLEALEALPGGCTVYSNAEIAAAELNGS
jgi:transcriptional/translational regulatory protein YebC/TACO1